MLLSWTSKKLSTHCITIKCCKLCKKKKSWGNVFASIKSMYDSLLSCVRANNEYSDLFFNCQVGVRHFSVH